MVLHHKHISQGNTRGWFGCQRKGRIWVIPTLVVLMSSLSLEVPDSSPTLITHFLHPKNTRGTKSNLGFGKTDRFHPAACAHYKRVIYIGLGSARSTGLGCICLGNTCTCSANRLRVYVARRADSFRRRSRDTTTSLLRLLVWNYSRYSKWCWLNDWIITGDQGSLALGILLQ